MERLKTLLARYSQTAFLIFMGLILIVYIGMGFLYLQQAPQQKDYQQKTDKLTAILRNPLPSMAELQASYDNVTRSLIPVGDNLTIAWLVELAGDKGIDISENDGKFKVPVPAHGQSGTYQTVSFKGVYVQGLTVDVEAFISFLDSTAPVTIPGSNSTRTLVREVTRLSTNSVRTVKTGDEAFRVQEWLDIQKAVNDMMKNNGLARIPEPVRSPTNYMGDDPATPAFEGFPDARTTVLDKGYTGNATIKPGYLLNGQDQVSLSNSSVYTTANYTQNLTTIYYYTVDRDGTVHQWNPANLTKEYTDADPDQTELVANMDITLYFKGQ